MLNRFFFERSLAFADTEGEIIWQDNWANGCDFKENDLNNRGQMPSTGCDGLCATIDGCTHFSWTDDNGGTCWMKYGPVTKRSAVATEDRTSVCGITHSSGGFDGQKKFAC